MDFKINNDWALFYGIMIGDGCISKYKKYSFVVITCNIFDDEPFFNEIVIPLLSKIRGKPVKYRKREKYGKIEINFSDKDLFRSIASIGYPIGKKGKIIITDKFPMKLWKHIIAGIFATDGSLVVKNNNNNGTIYPRIEIRSISGELLNQIKTFLIENGLNGNVYEVEKHKINSTYRMEFPGENNLIKFKEKIGFVNPKHLEKYNLYMEKKNFSWNEWNFKR
ncbi:MAG: LAGLIDADG family homing endonuclease [Candidatus Aenigmarchaeota archaeon]|nr:LAGLIDADG family homing endonuclease [Candidatus Aenigmarchaeota archaeon]